jgi:uncharacterized protein (TIGR00288 family)
MKDIFDEKKIAVLIDADNAQYSRMKTVLREVSTHGHIITKRAYGDWSSSNLKNWKDHLNELAIQPVQQFAYTQGKNSTDAHLIIDAMDLLYSEKYDAFVLVSSDSDFTRLASRLRESQKYVIGVGESKTPISFRNACDEFIIVENLDDDESAQLAPSVDQLKPRKAAKPKAEAKPKDTEGQGQDLSKDSSNSPVKVVTQEEIVELVAILRKAYEKYVDDDGWANVAPTGSFIKRVKPDFDPRTYKFSKVPDLIASLSDHFEMTKFPGKGKVNIVAFRPKGIEKDF